MLKPKLAGAFAPHLNDVVGDMIRRIRKIRDSQTDEELVREIPFELYKWAMECKYNFPNENSESLHLSPQTYRIITKKGSAQW